MGDTDPGSSMAARRAQLDMQHTPQGEHSHNNNGTPSGVGRLWARLGGAKRPAPTVAQPIEPAQKPGMINLRRMRVDDVAVPRADIVSVAHDIKKDELVKVFRESGNTRLPVYKETLDEPIGLVHLKDFSLNHGFNGKGERFNLKKMLRPLLYAPPSMPIGVLLQKMQSERVHMALVIDEYGGVDGLLTLEDLVEQVLGEIEDEHDTDEGGYWTRVGEGIYTALAKTPLEDFEAEIGLRLADDEIDEEIDTLGGLVFMLIGRVPVRNEVIPHPSGAEFEIMDADPRRIKRLRVRLPHAAKARKAASPKASTGSAK